MSLLDDLKAAGQALDAQFAPNTGEVQHVLGALVHYVERGEDFLKAAAGGVQDVAELLGTGEKPAPPQAPAPAGEPANPLDRFKSAPGETAGEPAPVVDVSPDAEQAPHDAAAAAGQAPPPDAPVSDDELERQIADLQSRLAVRRATSQQTIVEHEPGG